MWVNHRKYYFLLVLLILFSLLSIISYANINDSNYITGFVNKDITGKVVSGTINIGICLNNPPTIISSDCPNSLYINETLNCSLNGVDNDINQNLSYSSEFITSKNLFSINSSGELFQSRFNVSDIGLHLYNAYVFDNSGCENNFYSNLFSLQLLCPNNNPIITGSSCPNKISFNQGLNCRISASDSDINQNITYYLTFENASNNNLFSINSSTGRIVKNSFNESDWGIYNYSVTVNDGAMCDNFSSNKYTLEISKINHAPVCSKSIKDKNDVPSGASLLIKMSSYCKDEDYDPLTFGYLAATPQVGFSFNIINDELVFNSESWFYGDVYVYFNASDSNLSDKTNTFKITVKKQENQEDEKTTSVQQSSGANLNEVPMAGAMLIRCMPNWVCGNWSECKLGNIKTRQCIDVKNCNTTIFKPNETTSCVYTPTCFDGAKNGLEDDVDCGGNCKACINPFSCNDSIKNCHDGACEEGIDCGGPCKSCKISNQSCFDGVKNCHDGACEDGVDCGNICNAKCAVLEKPINSNNNNNLLILLSLIIVMGLLSMSYHYVDKNKRLLLRLIRVWISKFKKVDNADSGKKQVIFLLEELDNLEANIKKDNPKKTLSKILKVMGGYLSMILRSEEKMQYNEILKKLDESSSIIIKDYIKNLITDLEEIEFSQRELDYDSLMLLIYEMRTFIFTYSNLELSVFKNEFLPDISKENPIIRHICNMNISLIKNEMTYADNLRKHIYEIFKTNHTTNKLILNSFLRINKIYLYKNNINKDKNGKNN